MGDIIKNSKGKFCILLSAFLYGLAPILAKFTYQGGANGITLTFLRAAITVPLLFVLMRADRTSIYVSKTDIRKIILLGFFGGTMPIGLLYLSYNYIAAGLATTLHFIYPLVIVLASAFIYREKVTPLKLLAVVLVTIGIILFVEIETNADKIGVILALLSGIFYSFYVLYLDKSGLDRMDYIKLTFYMTLTMSATTLIFGLAVNEINFDMTARAWAYAGLISLLITVFATPLFQIGVKYEGASTAGVLSTFEPITTTALGFAFLGEHIGMAQLAGGMVIITGLVLAQKYG